MGYISKLILVVILVFTSCKNQAQKTVKKLNEPVDIIYGEWKYVKHSWWKTGRYTKEQIEELNKTILKVEGDKIYFENVDFIDSCRFSKENIKTTKLLDKSNEEYYWFEEGETRLLPTQYTGPIVNEYDKKQLSQIDKIDLGCESGLGIIYLDGDTMILNYLGGVTVFLSKVD